MIVLGPKMTDDSDEIFSERCSSDITGYQQNITRLSLDQEEPSPNKGVNNLQR
jgi:hypothetical protein